MKLLVVFSIAISLGSALFHHEDKVMSTYSITSDSTEQYKINAFSILQNKCNVCHSKQNRNAVFTYSNMNTWSGDIKVQVFIRQRMPKGNTIVLTETDKVNLTKWIQSVK